MGKIVRGKIVGKSGGYIPVKPKPKPLPVRPKPKPKPKPKPTLVVPKTMGFNRKKFLNSLEAEDKRQQAKFKKKK